MKLKRNFKLTETNFFREASEVKPVANTLEEGDVNDLLKSQAVVVVYEKSGSTHKKSLRRSIDHLTEDNIVSVSYVQVILFNILLKTLFV